MDSPGIHMSGHKVPPPLLALGTLHLRKAGAEPHTA